MKKIICSIMSIGLIITIIAYAFSSQEMLATVATFKVFVDGIEKKFEKAIVVINDNTYLPLREVAETLGMDVNWDEAKKTISIQSQNPEALFLIPFKSKGLWGYMDKKGDVIVDPKYIKAGSFNEGLALVSKAPGSDAIFSGPEGLFGFINQFGEEIISCTYINAYDFSNGAALVSLGTHIHDERWTYIDKQGNRLSSDEFALARSFSDGYALVLMEGSGRPLPPGDHAQRKWSFISINGEFATDLEFEDAFPFKNGHAIVKMNERWGVIDLEFNFVIPCQYDEIGAW